MYTASRRIPAQIIKETEEAARKIAIMAWKATHCRDYARVDMRFDGEKIWVLEVNQNPDISPDAGFDAAIKFCGIGFTEFVRRIVLSAQSRCWKPIAKQ